MMGQPEYLQSILIDKYVPQAIAPHVPETTVEYTDYLANVMDNGAYFVVLNMPQGSTLTKQIKDEPPTRLDAYRGLLAFTQDDFLYLISSQRSFFDGEVPGTMAQEAEALKNQILNFIDTIEFGAG